MLIVVGDFGGIHKSTASVVIRVVSEAIAELSPEFIKLPRTQEELEELKNNFYNIARFPNTIGTIDCTHVRIQSSGGNNAENFRNRKGYFSVNVQTLSDAHLRITDIVARWPGATNDRTIFSNCRLKANLEAGTFGNSFIIGDSGYTLTEDVMIPVQNPNTPAENLFNESIIRTRNVVERQYGVWKRRFQVLRLEMRVKLSTALTIIVATAVIHNVALQFNDPEPVGDEQVDIREMPQPVVGNGVLVRTELINNYFGPLVGD